METSSKFFYVSMKNMSLKFDNATTPGDLASAYFDVVPRGNDKPAIFHFPYDKIDIHPKTLCRHVSMKEKLVKIL